MIRYNLYAKSFTPDFLKLLSDSLSLELKQRESQVFIER